MAERLAKEGYFVYAGARKDKDLAELGAIENIRAVRLNVTSWLRCWIRRSRRTELRGPRPGTR
ncbi:MAG: hypothetical protein KC572_08045 [Gammaproteobacteria bacterium]|nr:hypothetical protein [Gammaproteobacteria bacterium]